MYTIFDLQHLCETDLEGYRNAVQTLRDGVQRLNEAYNATRDASPRETVRTFCEAVGENAAAVVATLVNRIAWDGRISERASSWASRVLDAYDADAANRIGYLGCEIHPAHLDQIAVEMATERREDA